MTHFKQDIGCAAGIVPFHATRLIIDGHESVGAGSAALDDEDFKEDQHIDGDGDDGNDDLVDDQPSGRRSRQDKAYDAVKSERDRLKSENEKKDRTLQEVQSRLANLEQSQQSRKDVNERTNATLDQAKVRAREVVSEIKKLDREDPEYSEKVYETMFSRLYSDQQKTAEEVSRRTSNEVYTQTQTQEQRKAEAEETAIAELEAAGLSAKDLRLVQFVASEKMRTEGEAWFRNTPQDEQVPLLVKEVATMLRGSKRGSQEFRDEKRDHRKVMDGVIGESARGMRGPSRGEQEDEGKTEGPGSILADLARLRSTQRQSTKVMLRQAER